MDNKYAYKELKENMARALVKDASISTKTSIEMAKFLKGKTTEKAKTILNRVLEKKTAIPFTRFTNGLGHRAGSGIGTGRFPQKATEEFLDLIKSVEANAQAKGLSTNLKIIHLLANKASNQFHYGRQRRRKYKRTHLELVVEEQEETKQDNKKANKKAKPAQKTSTVENKTPKSASSSTSKTENKTKISEQKQNSSTQTSDNKKENLSESKESPNEKKTEELKQDKELKKNTEPNNTPNTEPKITEKNTEDKK
ncbi:50S ribosomal protein L22 [Candidatus Woesearchaeota archaeon]|nr:50S ribosomal protein L22 [Candidatus Woesearchaeota archaeon]